ncbi:spore cortex-lytic protein [Clostridium polyendosporum]|uniref:Spore cortex-lytic protein n=1 Tax=Clostridium polyendosporum TaxID=69208 RepID=A0A919RYQ0_9CLOT|nr:peptidoglycan-binding domain-containing protein [Clostridium polyendosporum]GIM28985.1 spore cortex-lytic protein [Clostridium polyendosporum]
MAIGRLKIQAFRGNEYIPLDNSRITISQVGEFATPGTQDIQVTTDSSGTTPEVELQTPPIEYSQVPTDQVPYSLCDIKIEREGFAPVFIRGSQIFPERIALQQANLQETRTARQEGQIILIQPNRLVGNFPPKIPEDPEKPLPPPVGTVVLPEPVVPEFVVVHQGVPDDPAAPNYTVRYKDYIKNVASSEIFATWPDTTIRANVYCIVSFTLNRIYTEWYRGKGKNFDITSSTAYDHAFSFGRNIYDNISSIVDEIFATYIKRFGRKQPLLTQYCDGQKVQCPGWLTQWGSKYLGDQGRAPYEILTNFYGTDIELRRAEEVEGIPTSYPGYTLTIGARGEPVRTVQEFLNRIAENYPLIPKVPVDGVYGPATQEAVKVFQSVFNLPQTGNVDYATWYRISDIYVGVTKIAELRRSSGIERIFFPPISYDSYRPNNTPHVPYFDDQN